MTALERRVGLSLAAIFGLRMLGLFLILPVFAVYAHTLPQGNDATLVGIALGAYGATQALLQIPLGLLSDRIGRKPVIIGGLLLFALGCLIAAAANDIYVLIAGRVIQGMGAISAAISALAADLTRENQRTKVMAMIGSSIGLIFAVSLVAAPPLYAAIGLPGIFVLTGVLALAGVVLIVRAVPQPPAPASAARPPFRQVLLDGQLARMNFGVLALHIMQTALWIVVPALLVSAGLPLGEHWKIYLPAVLLSFAVMIPVVIHSEKKKLTQPAFIAAILLLIIAQAGFGAATGVFTLGATLLIFFIGFNLMEALQPALISRLAPPAAKGAAMGIYNTTQSIGIACGGVFGGWLLKHAGAWAVQAFCAGMGAAWLILVVTMKAPLRGGVTYLNRRKHGICQ